MPIAAGTHLGPYEILAPLGAGGMGEVYRARDTKLHRDVAIKVLPESLGADPDRRARFEREAHVLASLNHPHIAQIHGFEDSTGVPALVMELVEGPTLADRIARGRVPVGEALAIARQIAEALDAAHEQGIIHRDLKPANIQVRDDGTVKVLDFGLAKAVGPAEAGPHVQAGHGHTADESGRREIHVRPFPAFDRKWTISTDGGAEPIWRRDGKELFYRNRDTVMTVTTDMSAGFKASAPQALFRGDYDQTNATTGHPHFDVASDGQRFLMVKPEKSASQIVVVLNWLDEFKRRAAETR